MLPNAEVIDKVLLIILVLIVALILSTTHVKATNLNAHLGTPFILVNIHRDRSVGKLHYVDADGHIVYSTWISSGASKYRTPSGTYNVYYKKRHHMSTKYPEASGINNMDYSLFFLNGFALHQGNPRQKSHGCVHVAPGIAQRLFNDVEHGTPVVITRVETKKQKKQKKKRFLQSKIDYIVEGF